jgi:hypothetical protein
MRKWILLALFAAVAARADSRLPPVGGGVVQQGDGRPRIEVAFVLDATSSMQPYIDAARRRIADIAAQLAAGDPPPQIRFGLVSYRDKGDAYVTKVNDFSASLAEMRRWLDGTQAEGGGDQPESVLEGLQAGLERLSWTPPDRRSVKLLYLVGDAPPHHYPDSPPERALTDEALRRGIAIHTIACGDMDDEGQSFFEQMARRSEGRAFRLGDRASARSSAVGAAETGSLGDAVAGSARAYSTSAGIHFGAIESPIALEERTMPALDGPSGLEGAQLRVVADAAAWRDLWAAHASLSAHPPPPPAIDFARHQLLVVGGRDAGLAIDAFGRTGEAARVAKVRRAGPSVRFFLVPPDRAPVVVQGGAS